MSDRQDGIRNLHALVCPWVQGKSSPPKFLRVRGRDRKWAQGQTCQRLLARLQPPGLALVVPRRAGRRFPWGVVGLAWGAMPPGLSASRTGPARQRMAAARPCIICSGYRLRSLELSFSSLGCDPWLQRRSCQWWRGRPVDNFTTTWPKRHSSNLMREWWSALAH